MRFIQEKYRVISIWLSLLILALAAVIGSDEESWELCVPLAFLAGTLLHAVGMIREWRIGRMPACLIYALLMICMMMGLVLSLLRLGGII